MQFHLKSLAPLANLCIRVFAVEQACQRAMKARRNLTYSAISIAHMPVPQPTSSIRSGGLSPSERVSGTLCNSSLRAEV